jgi:hypothetical protein
MIHAYTWLYMVIPHLLLILRIEVWEGALFQILSPNLVIFGGNGPGEFGLGQPRGDLRAGAKRVSIR